GLAGERIGLARRRRGLVDRDLAREGLAAVAGQRGEEGVSRGGFAGSRRGGIAAWRLMHARDLVGRRRARPADRQQEQRQQGRDHRAAGHQLVAAAAGLELADDEESDDLEPPPSARLRFLSPSFLKSVSYQPPPASRNEGAVTWRRILPGALHEGQVSGSASDSFCRRSKAWPQASHWKA